MTAPKKNQPSFDDEISVADIVHFFKSHKKFISICIILGLLFGGLFGQISGPVYKGSVLISPARVAGAFVVNPKITITKLDMNSYYSKETFLNCNPDFYKDKDKDIDYDMSDIVKSSITKDGDLIELRMQDKNKTIINNCLMSLIEDVRRSQNTIANPLIESKTNDLRLAEEKLINLEEFKNKLNERRIEQLNTNDARFSKDLIYTNMILSNNSNIKELMSEVNKLKTELSSEQTKSADKVLPINIEKKSFPSLKLGALLGLFFGLGLGVFISLIKQIEI
jgi:hypothetical protein